MDLSMSTGSISALGILTNSEPLRGISITKDDAKNGKKDEVKLIFLGTFFHEDSNALNADLIQIKEPAQIREIRVIPLGATVNLSTGSYQLGATNPSELELEFYYNDLQVPSKSAFTLLQNFSFNDKSKIHLTVDPEEQIITDGLIVRGIYSTITLAVYGFAVDEVPLKEPTVDLPTTDLIKDKENAARSSVSPDPTASPYDIDSPKKHANSSAEALLVSPNTSEDNRSDLLPSKPPIAASTPFSDSKRALDPEPPRAIPTTTTRVKFDSAFPVITREEQSYTEEPIDRERDPAESDLSSDEHFDGKSENVIKPLVQVVPPAQPVAVLPEVEDAEDISDGEVFPEEEEMDIQDKDVTPNTSAVDKVTSPSFPVSVRDVVPSTSPAIEPLSDQEDCLLDEFPEPGVEEIVSDEEMPEFPEYEYGEWEEQWTHIFGPSFNPFSESFQVSSLKNFKVTQTLGPVTKSAEEMLELLTAKANEWSRSNFKNEKIEAWVQDMEDLLPIIPRCCNTDDGVSDGVRDAMLYWTAIGIDLSLAKAQSSLPYKTRHIKVGIKLVHALALSGEKVVDQLLEYRIDEDIIEGGTTIQQKLIEIFEEQYMSTTMRLSILRALDCFILTKEGLRTFVGDEDDDNSSYGKLLEFSLNKNVGTRVCFSIRSFLKKVKLLEDLNTFEEFVLGIVKNSSAELSTSVEAQDVDDCVHILETLRDMAKNVDQYLSHPLRILPAGSLVELPPTSVAGHDPKISFIKSLEQYRFIKLCTVLVNNKDLYGRTGGLVSEIISILLEWEPGLVYLSSESESTTILLKTLAQLEEDGNSIALYACHCLEVMRCIDKLTEPLDYQDHQKKTEEEKNEDIACLQTLVSFLATQLGRQALSCTLTIGDSIVPLLKCLRPTGDSRFIILSAIEKTVRRGYASKVVGFIVRNAENAEFFMRHGAKLHDIISDMEEDPDGLTGNLTDVLPFLRSSLNTTSFSLEGIQDLFNTVKSNQDILLRTRTDRTNWGYSPEMIQALRLLSAQVVPTSSDDVKNCIAADVDDMLIKELKYEVALIKLHSFDAISTFLAILQKITDDFNGQPGTLCHTLITGKGDALVNLLSPMLRLIRRIISQVVHVRKTEFKDTTAIPVLLKVFSVIECIPHNAPSYRRSREVAQNVIGSLLAYTIPALKQGVESEEELNKSTWTAVVSEIIKYTMEEPATFQTGVSMFSELLPLPLPIASKIPLNEAECLENVKLRRLWSAYIHGLSTRIQEMIGVLCGSTNSRLITLLKRLCVQLADLSASTCMVVCRAVLDAVQISMESDMELQQQAFVDSQLQSAGASANSSQNSSIKAWLDQSKSPKMLSCSGNTARLLGFLSSLVNNSGTIKSRILQALRGVLKLDEKYTELITQFCCVLTNNSGLSSQLPACHVQAQENIVTIFQSLCDQEINMIVPMYGFTGKIFDSKFVLANSLPPKDIFITICNAFIMYVCTTPYKLSDSRVMEGVLRGLEIISETEYGFYHMRSCIEKTNGVFKNMLVTLSETDLAKTETFDAIWSCISSTVELLRSLTSARHGTGSNVTNRASVLTKQEFKNAVDWPGTYKKSEEELQEEAEKIKAEPMDADDDDEESLQKNFAWSNSPHPLAKLSRSLSKFLAKLNDPTSTQTQVTIEATEVENTASMLITVLEFLEEKESGETLSETLLPPPDLLQELFSKRPVFVIVEKLGSENLPPFWLTSIPPAFDLDAEYSDSDLIACDLNELCQSFIPDVDITKELERFYKSNDGINAGDKEDASSNEKAKLKHSMDTPTHSVLIQLTAHRKPFGSHLRGGMRGGFGRGLQSKQRGMDPFRSRPPNTSRPPSLHVDDFVALESSGQSGSVAAAYNKGGMRGGMDNFSPRGRGNSRGSLLGRPYNDRGRFRTPQGGGSYFGQRMDGQQNSPRRGSRGGMGKGYGNDQRWSGGGDNRDNSSPYMRQDHSGGGRQNMYDDKFRSSTPVRSQVSSGGNGGVRNQPYQSRNSYREAPPMGRNNNNSIGGGNDNSAQRWRERQRPFNR